MSGKRDKRKARQKKQSSYMLNRERWAAKTNAQIWNEGDFLSYKASQGFFVLGVMGFAGSWKRSGRKGDELARYIQSMRDALAKEFFSFHDAHCDRLIISSGATYLGVLQLTYDLCDEHGIWAMGVTSDAALRYTLGNLQHLIPHGHRFGDESDIFVRTSDAFLLLGGGAQSRRESLSAYKQGKPLVIVQGFGGVADEFSRADFPDAQRVRFVSVG